MPWLWLLLVILGVYLAIKILQGGRDFMIWYMEGRAFAREQERARQRRKKGQPPPPTQELPEKRGLGD